jgi:hypothetical protein
MYWPEQGPWQNQLLTVGFDRAVYLLTLDPSGQVLTDKRVLAFYLGGVLLDVWAQRADSVFPHSIWVADHGQDAIYVLDPSSTAPADRIVQFFHSKIVYTRRALADAMARAQDSYRRWNQRRQVPEQE